MDVTLTDHEQDKISKLTKLFPISADVDLVDRYLKDVGITPDSCTPKGFALIVFFFYFYDWLKHHDMRAYYSVGDKVMMKNKDATDYNNNIKKLFKFLKLTTKRLGGQTFSATGWIQEITTQAEPQLQMLTWKKISVCTLHTPFGIHSPTFTSTEFKSLCDVIFKITTKFKINLTIKGPEIREGVYLMHDVMIVGIERGNLLISNSWGNFLDFVPVDELPSISLKGNKMPWEVFQFTFFLPMVKPIEFDTQYDATDLTTFLAMMESYYPQMDILDSLPKIDPAVFDALAESPRAAVGGTKKRNKRKRYTRFVRRRQ